MAESNTSNIGFEKQIWDAACVLRGNIDASEYKSVVLGLIFLKYISDRFETKYNELVEEGDGFEEDKDEYMAENIFFVPENARWNVIAAAAHTPVQHSGIHISAKNMRPRADLNPASDEKCDRHRPTPYSSFFAERSALFPYPRAGCSTGIRRASAPHPKNTRK